MNDTKPTIAAAPIVSWDQSCQTYLENRTKSAIDSAKQDDPYKVYGLIVVGAILTLVGTTMLTNFAATNLVDSSPFTHVATVGTYSMLCILVSVYGVAMIVYYAKAELQQEDDERRLRIQLQTLENMQKFEVINGNVHLHDLTIRKEVIVQKENALRQELGKVLKAKEESWQPTKEGLNTALSAVAIGVATCIATIFASEYLPKVLTSISAHGSTAGVFFAGAGLMAVKIIHSPLPKQSREAALGLLVPLAFFVAALVGTILASEYLPHLMDKKLAAGMTAAICLTGFAATTFALIDTTLPDISDKNMRDRATDLTWTWAIEVGILALSILATSYAATYLPEHLTQVASDGTCAGIFLAGAGISLLTMTYKLYQKCDQRDSGKESAKLVPTYFETLAIFILTLVGTIFASEYLPRIMDNTSAQAAAAMIGLVGFSATVISIVHKLVENEHDKKMAWKTMESVLLLALSIFATVYASQHLPDSRSVEFRSGICWTIGVVGISSAIALWIYNNLKKWESVRTYKGTYKKVFYSSYGSWSEKSDYYYTIEGIHPVDKPDYIEGLDAMKNKDAFLKSYKIVNFEHNARLAVWSWLGPLTISMIGIVIGCLATHEFAHDSPYGFIASTLLPVGLSVLWSLNIHKRHFSDARLISEAEDLLHKSEDAALTAKDAGR